MQMDVTSVSLLRCFVFLQGSKDLGAAAQAEEESSVSAL